MILEGTVDRALDFEDREARGGLEKGWQWVCMLFCGLGCRKGGCEELYRRHPGF